MISLINKLTTNLKKTEIKEILKLKNQEWRYGFNSQQLWFKKYIKSNDIHIILLIDNKIQAYTCLRNRSYKIGKNFYKYLFFDTLIVRNNVRKKGFGKLIMEYNNYIINKQKKPSFLVCRKKNIKFYIKNNWKLINGDHYKIMDNSYKNQNGMVFN
jgi:hypothetical protein